MASATSATVAFDIDRASSPGAVRARSTMAVFTLTSLLGSSLLFLVQPIVGRLLLPRAGGTASLWNTAMVFFQAVLLVGYLAAHFGTTRLGVHRHRWLHIAIVAAPLAFLPIGVPDDWSLSGGSSAIVSTVSVLAVMVGVPFLALSTSSPTLQRWFAATDHPDAADPYFLYAAGNVGSLAALVAYPLMVERHLGLEAQTRMFMWLYVAFLVCTVTSALLIPRRTALTTAIVARSGEVIGWARRLRWVWWSLIPSALLLGTTRGISTDIASFPLLWIVPLVLYLLSFIIGFGVSEPARVSATAGRFVVIGAVPVALTFVGRVPMLLALALHLGWMFAAATLAHARLSSDRPAAERLTEFYAWISVGGVVGGTASALIAPLVFTRVWEYPIAIVAAICLCTGASDRRGSLVAWAFVVGSIVAGAWLQAQSEVQWATIAMAIAGLLVLRWHATSIAATIGLVIVVATIVVPEEVLHRDRSFFGTYAVLETEDGTRIMQMGTTVHGSQRADGDGSPTTYYHPDGPLGDLLDGPRPPIDAALIGLGVGEIAAYGIQGDRFTWFEIDSTVVDIASNPAWFTYLRDTEADVDVIIGDGRLELERNGGTHDVVIVDAFSSDAIPVHLLTEEAVAGYLDRTSDEGIVAVHISNRHLDLAPVIGRIAGSLGVTAALNDFRPDADQRATGAFASDWVVVSRSAAAIDSLGEDWERLAPTGPHWTDDATDVLSVLRG